MSDKYKYRFEGTIETVGYVGNGGKTHSKTTHDASTNDPSPIAREGLYHGHAIAAGESQKAMITAVEQRRIMTGD